MSTESAPPQAQQLAAIFQKAYARAVALQRMDEQIGSLLEQRQRLENEFREAQAEVNAECDRMLKSASIAPAKILAQLAEATTSGVHHPVEHHAVEHRPVEVTVHADANGRLSRSREAARS